MPPVEFALLRFQNMLLYIVGEPRVEPPEGAELVLTGAGNMGECNLGPKEDFPVDKRGVEKASDVGNWVLGSLWHFCRSQKELKVLAGALEGHLEVGLRVEGVDVEFGPIPTGAYQITPFVHEDYAPMKGEILGRYGMTEAEFDIRNPVPPGKMLCEFLIAWNDFLQPAGSDFTGDAVIGVTSFLPDEEELERLEDDDEQPEEAGAGANED